MREGRWRQIEVAHCAGPRRKPRRARHKSRPEPMRLGKCQRLEASCPTTTTTTNFAGPEHKQLASFQKSLLPNLPFGFVDNNNKKQKGFHGIKFAVQQTLNLAGLSEESFKAKKRPARRVCAKLTGGEGVGPSSLHHFFHQ